MHFNTGNPENGTSEIAKLHVLERLLSYENKGKNMEKEKNNCLTL